MRSTEGQRLLALDHLRALAAALVFYWHGLRYLRIETSVVPSNWILSLFEEGWAGVSLFIAITGFMFTVMTHGREIHYFPFLRNRFLRIFPLLFLVMLFAVSYKDLSPTALFAFFNLLGGGVVFGTWSLVVEWQYYVAYPFIRDTIVRTKEDKKTILWGKTLTACLGLAVIFMFFRMAYYFEKSQVQGLAYWTLFGQAEAFITGMIAGLAYIQFRGRFYAISVAILIVTILSILFANHQFNLSGGFYPLPKRAPSPSPIWLVWPTISALLWGSLIFSYCMVAERYKGHISRFFAGVGSVSYSTYMLHFISLPLIAKLLPGELRFAPFSDNINNAFLLLMIWFYPATLVLSKISFELIEKPFLGRRVAYLGPRNSSASM